MLFLVPYISNLVRKAKFSIKLIFVTPPLPPTPTHPPLLIHYTYVCISGGCKKCKFRGKFWVRSNLFQFKDGQSNLSRELIDEVNLPAAVFREYLSSKPYPINACINHFMSLISFCTPLKSSENLWFSDFFRGRTYKESIGMKLIKSASKHKLNFHRSRFHFLYYCLYD